MVLAAAARPDETVYAVDVFERQDLNIDGSGSGNREIFLGHIQRFFPGARLSLIAETSAKVKGNEEAFGLAKTWFLSIDGGHTRSLTYNDLQIADASLVAGGVCCLDDVFNYHWTGVVSGLFEFLNASTGPTLVPFAFLPNKLFLCRPTYKELYASYLRTTMDYALERPSREFWRTSIDVYGERWPQASATFTAFAELTGVAAAANERTARAERRAAEAEEQRQEAVNAAAAGAQYLRQRSTLEKLLFRIDGRPIKPLRRMLFHNSGGPRKFFRIVVLHKNGQPRRAFRIG